MLSTPEAQQLPKLGEALSRALRDRGQKLEIVASKLGITYNALRQDLAKSRFYPDDLSQLLQMGGFPTEIAKIEASFAFTWKQRARGIRKATREFADRVRTGNATLEEVFAEFATRMVSVRDSLQSIQKVIPKFFKTLDAGDVVALFISDEIPAHWERGNATEWLEPMLRALKRGAKILYVYPSTETYQLAQECGVRILPPDVVSQEFSWFRQRLTFSMEHLPSELNCNNLDDSLFLIPHKCHVICTPRHRYALYIFNNGKHFATTVVPISGVASMATGHSLNYPLLELDTPFRSLLENALQNALQDFYTSAGSPTGVAVLRGILARLSGLTELKADL
jgi:hypothetical protein